MKAFKILAESIIQSLFTQQGNDFQMDMRKISNVNIKCKSGFYVVYASSDANGYINGEITTASNKAILASAIHVVVTGSLPHYPSIIDIFQFQIYEENSTYTLEFIAPSYTGSKIIHDCVSIVWYATSVYLFSFV